MPSWFLCVLGRRGRQQKVKIGVWDYSFNGYYSKSNVCVIGRQLIEMTGLLILVNFINLVDLGFQYLSWCWFAPYGAGAAAGVRHTSACRCSHTQPLCRQLNSHQSFPRAPTGVSEFARCGRDDDSEKPTGKKRLLSRSELRLCREVQYRWAGTLRAPGDVMLSAHLWPKTWLWGEQEYISLTKRGKLFPSALSSRQLVSAECWQHII